jgi:hypothetical protein
LATWRPDLLPLAAHGLRETGTRKDLRKDKEDKR